MATIADADTAGADARKAALRALILGALQAHGGNRTLAAAALGYAHPGALRRAARACGVDLTRIPAPTPAECGAKKKPRTPQSRRAAEPQEHTTMTNPSLATMIHEAQRAEEDARAVGMRDYAPDKWVTITSRLYALRRLASLCRRACGLARAGDSVVLVAPVGTSPDEVAGGLADEGAGRERVEVLCPTAEEWPAAYAAARQRKGVEVVS